MTSVQIRLYDLFRKELNLPDEKAAAFVSAVEDVVDNELKNERQNLATKGDVLSVKEDIHKLEIKLEQSKTDLYKAIFWTSIVQLFAILGGVLAIVKFMK